MMFAASRVDYDRDRPTMDLTSEHFTFYRLCRLQTLAPFWEVNPKCLDHNQQHPSHHTSNTCKINQVPVEEVEWSGNRDCQVLSDTLKEGFPFKITCAQLGLLPAQVLVVCQQCTTTDTTRCSSSRGTRLPLTIAETFSAERFDNCNIIEHGQHQETEKCERTECGNVYAYTVTDDRLGRNKKRKDFPIMFSMLCSSRL
jgi:hypothetical protein